MNTIVTPINAAELDRLLRETHYNDKKRSYIIDGFTNGFSIHYTGPTDRQNTSNNLKITIGSELELWNKVMTEVQLKRYSGPFDEIPQQFKNSFVQSPLGLVRKAGFTADGKPKTRLIFHLSHPRVSGTSVNAFTDENYKHVKYKDLDVAVALCLRAGPGCYMAKTGLSLFPSYDLYIFVSFKSVTYLCEIPNIIYESFSDFSAAFRQAPIRVEDRRWLLMKAAHPITGRNYFFVENCCPFGVLYKHKHFLTSDHSSFTVGGTCS